MADNEIQNMDERVAVEEGVNGANVESEELLEMDDDET